MVVKRNQDKEQRHGCKKFALKETVCLKVGIWGPDQSVWGLKKICVKFTSHMPIENS